MNARCQHPAVHYALREYVQACQHQLDRLQYTAKPPLSDQILALPGRLYDEEIQAARDNEGKPVYELPLQRFSLDDDRIRSLLLDESLLGHPYSAIRELYQNGLDACRHLTARLELLDREEKRPPEFSWSGRIRINQKIGPDQREFVECQDNGVGMDKGDLMELFAKAGARFCFSQEYRDEESAWRKHNPPIARAVNSQFGLGVYSYFLLADEIEIETCKFNRDGSYGIGLK